jgi:hypothetical protein
VSRATLELPVGDYIRLRAVAAAKYYKRAGYNRLGVVGGIDAATIFNEYFSYVEGAEFETNFLGNRISNIAFVKHYLFDARNQGLPVTANQNHFGGGDSLRVTLANGLWMKASYEYATRLPTHDEIFGDAILLKANPNLQPEVSHNGNVGAQVEVDDKHAGLIAASATGFIRSIGHFILLIPSAAQAFSYTSSYQNAYSATSKGVEAMAAWRSPGRAVKLETNFTYVDLRNTSNQGLFAPYINERIPARPWLFFNAGGSYRIPLGLLRAQDDLTLGYSAHYVHSFFIDWESNGLPGTQYYVPDQVTHDIYATYRMPMPKGVVSTTVEVHDLTNETVYDFFGAQRPPRSYFLKVLLEMY